MRVVILTSAAPSQFGLCHKLARYCEIQGIVVSSNVVPRPLGYRARLFANSLQGRIVGYPLRNAWFGMLQRYATEYTSFPEVPITFVRNVNDPQTWEVLRRTSPDLVIVSGTNLVARPLIQLASQKMGIINLHTGLSPYVKGGPNCTNWCLAERTFHLIGNTIMWLDPGIDSGPLITTGQTPLTGRESLLELHWKVMEHAHALCVRAVQAIGAGRHVPRVSQEGLDRGRTFYSREWNGRAIARALHNFSRWYGPELFRSEEFSRLSSALKLFSLSGIPALSRPSPDGSVHPTSPNGPGHKKYD